MRHPKKKAASPERSRDKDTTTKPDSTPRPGRLRKWAFRLLALVLAPIIFVGLLELGLRGFGYGYDTSFWLDAPGVEGKWLRSNPRFNERFQGKELARDPILQLVETDKPAGSFRVVVVGSSAAQGVPSPAYSFSRILEVMLRDAYPGRRIEVINTGCTAINSHVVLPILRDCARLKPDLVIVYMGNNEVIGPYGVAGVFGGAGAPLSVARASIAIRGTRTGQLMDNIVKAVRGTQQDEQKAWRGMEMFLSQPVSHDDPRLGRVYDNYRANLNDICAASKDIGAKVILSTLLTNVRDLPPFASRHGKGLAADATSKWEDLDRRAKAALAAGNIDEASGLFRQAISMDADYAETHFLLGQCLVKAGSNREARKHLERARDLDVMRFRADSKIDQIIREVADAHRADGVVLADPVGAVAGADGNGLPGFDLLYEHVHMKFEGNYLVASTLYPWAARAVGGLSPSAPLPPPAPPARCDEALVYGKYGAYDAAHSMNRVTSAPPFTPEQGRVTMAAAAPPDPLEVERACVMFRRRVRQYPFDVAFGSLLANSLLNAGRPVEAVEVLSKWGSVFPESLTFTLAEAQHSSGDDLGASATLRELVNAKPHEARTRANLAEYLAAAGQLSEAQEQYRYLLALTPEDDRARALLGRLLVKTGRKEEGLALIEQAIKKQPHWSVLEFFKAEALDALGRPDQAVACRRQAVQGSTLENRAKLAGLLLTEGLPLRAREVAAELVDSDATSALAYIVVAEAAIQTGDVDAAEQSFRKALAKDPGLWMAKASLARQIVRARALQRLDGLRARTESQSSDAAAWYAYAAALAGAGKSQDAVGAYQRALKIEPNHAAALNGLAWIRATASEEKLRDGKEAVVLAKHAIEVDGEQPGTLDTLAAAYARQGDDAQAVTTAQRSLAKAAAANQPGTQMDVTRHLIYFQAGEPYTEPR